MSLEPALLTRRWPERRAIVLATAAVAFVAVLVGTAAAEDPALAVGVLYLLPVMLVALETGLAGGLAAAALAVGLVLAGDPQLDPFGMTTHAVVLVCAGAIAGRFSDRMRAAHAREQRLLDSGLLLGELGAHERLPRTVAAAALRTPRAVGAVVELEGAATAMAGRADGRRTVTEVVAHGARLGRITVMHDAPLVREDRAALELLALQAGLAADNQRLLVRERATATLGAELRRARDELLEQRSGLGRLLDAQEDDRRRLADTLHEELAQVLAAVLMELRMLRRQDPGAGGPSLDELHGQVVGVLDDMRDVAAELRPSSLAQLGLVPALEALARHRGGTVAVVAEAVPEPLSEPLRTGIYRLVEHTLAAAQPSGAASVSVRASGPRLDVVLDVDLRGAGEPLAAARARVALMNGSLHADPLADGRTRVRVGLPLDTARHCADAPPR